jgi:anti-sigma B factor antagonist
MVLQLHPRSREGIRIVDLQGHLTIGESEAKLRDAILVLAEANILKIILNLADLADIDDDGLSALVFCYARVEKAGGALKLLNPPPHLRLTVLAKLDTVFEVFSDEQDAVNSFFPGRDVRRYDILDWVQEHEGDSAPET